MTMALRSMDAAAPLVATAGSGSSAAASLGGANRAALRVLHFNTMVSGGAARAALAVHRGVLNKGCDSWFFTAEQPNGAPRVIQVTPQSSIASARGWLFRRLREATYHRLQRKDVFSLDRFGIFDIDGQHPPVRPDIIHLHWVTELITSDQIARLWRRYRAPIVWSVVDLGPLTGGCHYSGRCDGYQHACGACPVIATSGPNDWSYRNLRDRRANLKRLPITIVGATDWILDRARKSALFREAPMYKIPYAIDPIRFQPIDRGQARRQLNVPPEGRLLFFGAHRHEDERKGIALLIAALRRLPSRLAAEVLPKLSLLVAGLAVPGLLDGLPFPIHNLGYITSEERLALAYQSADLFVCPSIDDAGPLMILESLMSGTPVVAFATCGGAPEFIHTGRSGAVVQTVGADALADGIATALHDVENGRITPSNCRAEVEDACSPDRHASRYVELYHKVITSSAAPRD